MKKPITLKPSPITGQLLKLGVFLSCIAGLTFHIVRSLRIGEAVSPMFLYYTIQSNILVGGVALLFFIREIRKGEQQEPWLFGLVIRYMSATSIFLTFLIFSVLLAPLCSREYLLSGSNIFLHNITPLLALADFIFSRNREVLAFRHRIAAIAFPLIYGVVTILLSLAGVRFNQGDKVPYFFLDYSTSGWISLGKNGVGVVYWFFILAALLLGMGETLFRLNRWVEKRRTVK